MRNPCSVRRFHMRLHNLVSKSIQSVIFSLIAQALSATPPPLPPTPSPTPWAPKPTAGPTSPAVNGVTIAIRPAFQTYTPNAMGVGVNLDFNNTSKSPQRFDLWNDVRFEVRGPAGALSAHARSSTPGYDRDIVVPVPTGYYSAVAFPTDTYNLSAAGIYLIRASITLHPGGFTVATPWTPITVAPRAR
jgi:hypothetical protein